jgi:hypothetical protein
VATNHEADHQGVCGACTANPTQDARASTEREEAHRFEELVAMVTRSTRTQRSQEQNDCGGCGHGTRQ